MDEGRSHHSTLLELYSVGQSTTSYPDNDSEQEKNYDCEIIHETVCIQLHDTLPTNSFEEKQPKQSDEIAVKQYEDKKEKVEEKTVDPDKAETKAARNEERYLEGEDRLQVEKENIGEGKTNSLQEKKGLEQPEHDHAAKAILSGDTLLKHLQKSKGKVKEQFKWLGDVQQLKGFVSIILNTSGKWRKSGNKNICKEDGGKFTLCWWSSNNTLNVQASQGSTEELEKRLNDLISKESQNTPSKTQNETEAECSKRTPIKKKNRPKKPEDSADDQTQEQSRDDQITSLWRAINTIKITLVRLQERIT